MTKKENNIHSIEDRMDKNFIQKVTNIGNFLLNMELNIQNFDKEYTIDSSVIEMILDNTKIFNNSELFLFMLNRCKYEEIGVDLLKQEKLHNRLDNPESLAHLVAYDQKQYGSKDEVYNNVQAIIGGGND